MIPQALHVIDGFLAHVFEKRFVTGGRTVTKVPMTMKKGQVSFHSCLTIHGSGANRSDRPRRSMAIHLQDGANRYSNYRHADGKLATHCNDRFVRRIDGTPDYADPALCPVLFRAAPVTSKASVFTNDL